jgi:outer membrane murein-binding lipoprotein Lpp
MVALSLLLLGAGCGDQKKVKECGAFVQVVNAGVDRVLKGMSVAADGGAAVGELRSLAEEMDAIAQETAKVELSLPELQQLSKDYQGMVTEVATAARELAQAVDNVDVEKMGKAQTRMDTAVKREDPLVESINKFCQSP